MDKQGNINNQSQTEIKSYQDAAIKKLQILLEQ